MVITKYKAVLDKTDNELFLIYSKFKNQKIQKNMFHMYVCGLTLYKHILTYV